MAARLILLAKVFVGFIRGGMAVVNVLASTLFGCISGSSVADTSAIGSVMIPQMVKQGYSRVFATNVTICGSVQALLIPPSHNAVIYSVAAGAHLGGTCSSPGCSRGAVRPVPDRPGAVDRAQAQHAEIAADPAARCPRSCSRRCGT